MVGSYFHIKTAPFAKPQESININQELGFIFTKASNDAGTVPFNSFKGKLTRMTYQIQCYIIPKKNMHSFLCVIFNTLRPGQNGRHFADDTFKCIFFNENVRNSIEISLKFVPKGPINNIPALVQIMAWRRPGNKPLSEPIMVRLLTHICVTQPQWVKGSWIKQSFHAFLYHASAFHVTVYMNEHGFMRLFVTENESHQMIS